MYRQVKTSSNLNIMSVVFLGVLLKEITYTSKRDNPIAQAELLTQPV